LHLGVLYFTENNSLKKESWFKVSCLVVNFAASEVCIPVCLRFKMAVLMGGRWFPYVECSSKKEGKKEAADVALRVLMAEGSYQLNDTPSSVCNILHTYIHTYR